MRIGVVIDCADPDALAPFWQVAAGYRVAHHLPGYLILKPDGAGSEGAASAAGGPGTLIVLQQVPEAKSGKNRLHLDVHPDDAVAHVERLEQLGARRVGPPVVELLDTAGVWWQVMLDPESNEFCVVADSGQPPT